MSNVSSVIRKQLSNVNVKLLAEEGNVKSNNCHRTTKICVKPNKMKWAVAIRNNFKLYWF